LYLKVKLLPHPLFTVKGKDVETVLNIRPDQAVLGDKVAVPTLEKTVMVTVPPGTTSGKRLRLRELGLPGRGGLKGDQFVKINIDIKPDISEEERELYRQNKGNL
jgi:curved DNA-binding protein